jgi:hypothetical protein
MGYSKENGYIPSSINSIMQSIMTNINTQFGTSYTWETFIGTNFYKYFYALAQKYSENEIRTSEIFIKLQDYFKITNESIARPVVTNPGLIEILQANDYIASVKPIESADAGKIYVCIDVDDTDPNYASIKEEICTIIKDSTVAGTVTQGTESESLTLTNGQSFDFKYNLPDRTDIYLKLTITTSENNQFVIKTPDEIKADLMANIAERYRLGLNFEPQKYYDLTDAPWASDVKLEWSDDDSTYYSTVFDADYDELFEIDLSRISVVES